MFQTFYSLASQVTSQHICPLTRTIIIIIKYLQRRMVISSDGMFTLAHHHHVNTLLFFIFKPIADDLSKQICTAQTGSNEAFSVIDLS